MMAAPAPRVATDRMAITISLPVLSNGVESRRIYGGFYSVADALGCRTSYTGRNGDSPRRRHLRAVSPLLRAALGEGPGRSRGGGGARGRPFDARDDHC